MSWFNPIPTGGGGADFAHYITVWFAACLLERSEYIFGHIADKLVKTDMKPTTKTKFYEPAIPKTLGSQRKGMETLTCAVPVNTGV